MVFYKKRYINTVVNDNYVRLKLSRCNFCPLLLLDTKAKLARCRKVKDNGKFKELEKFFTSDKLSGREFTNYKIDIKDWCELSKDKRDKDDLTVYETSVLGYISHQEKYHEYDIIKDVDVEYKDNKLVKIKQRNFNTNYRICSCCGKYDYNVRRKINLGMCSKCFEKYSDDDTETKYLVKINNFRLKRKVDYSNKNFKKIENFLHS